MTEVSRAQVGAWRFARHGLDRRAGAGRMLDVVRAPWRSRAAP